MMSEKSNKSGVYRAVGLGVSIPGMLAACMVVGALLGSWLDKQLSTGPWLLLLFLVLGFAAGIRETLKLIRRMGE